jgi:hypothetical protein
LDIAVLNIQKEFYLAGPSSESRINLAYTQLGYKERLEREKGNTEESNKIAALILKTKSSLFVDTSYKKLAYVRYADD